MYSYVILLQRYYFYLIYAINLMIPHYKEDGVHIVKGVYAMLQSITKVFISIGYVSVILYAGCETDMRQVSYHNISLFQ